ncbi:cytochrome C peroxidase [Endozoicomonas sp. SM1973]|uniref:Cytochrome C peroxidase n=1 Tax=Spartinivicinus marinus TaxID=2994442 RepID=A0A853I322_9GAMM|nr:cytochrome c peroxidase [Spartinivicinus marinus]MCX4029534.1 cytochrome C peroxidase [Spartinivicinus marinus]NYZ65108.1 cytochrome C peroxidase [Spartinivicinus marinus]
MLSCINQCLYKLLFSCLLGIGASPILANISPYHFTDDDIQFLAQFRLGSLPPLPAAKDNQYADSITAATLGKTIFFDKRFSVNKQVACASCHDPSQYFTDGLVTSKGIAATRRNAPSILGAAYSPWQFWDGRKDSLWSQALGPLESVVEHGLSRLEVVQLLMCFYQKDYQSITANKVNANRLFELKGPASPIGSETAKANWQQLTSDEQILVNRIFSDVGKLLMAYQRQLQPLPSRFDRFVAQLQQDPANINQLKTQLTAEEVSGLRLFMGKANCASCHNGPLFTNFEFHNIGAPEPDITQVDMGRYQGVGDLLRDEFTCLSKWSDANKQYCQEMLYLKKQGQELVGAFKTPSLRNIAATAPYMQSGQFATLEEVLAHYNKPVPPYYDRNQHPFRPHFDILPLGLTPEEIQQIKQFLTSLTGDLGQADQWWQTPD